MLYLVQRVFFGPLKEPGGHGGHSHPVHDLSLREIFALVPLLAVSLWIGLAPDYFFARLAPGLEPVLTATRGPLERLSGAKVVTKSPALPAADTASKKEDAP